MWGWLRYALTASPMIDLFASTQLTPARSREPPAAGTPAGPARCGSAGPSPTGTGTARCPYTATGSLVAALAITLPPPPDRPPRLRPDPPTPCRRARARRAARFPPHANGVGSAFQCPAAASNQPVTSPGVEGCWPSSARRSSTRWMLSATFGHDPPKGVSRGITPSANSRQTNSGVLCPARSSSIRIMRNRGGSAGSVIGQVRPCCHRSQDARPDSPGGTGSRLRWSSRSPPRPRRRPAAVRRD